MAAFTYPGVYIEEISSGQHSITGVATSIAAFIGYTNVGPVDEAVMVESWAEYESLFGGMMPGVYLGYAVYQFFLNGGSQAYIVRLCNTDSSYGANSVAVAASASIGGMTINANNPGVWGNNIAVAITGINSVNSTFNLQVYELTGSGSLSMVESYTNLSTNPANASYAVTIVNNDSNYIALTSGISLPTSSAGYCGVYTINGNVTQGVISQGDALTQSGSGAEGTVLVAPTATLPMTIQLTKTSAAIDMANPTDTWSKGLTETFTQSGAPTQMPMALVSGSITGGPFTPSETVTQLQSGATAICVGSTPSTLPNGLATPGLLLLQYITVAPANSFAQWTGGTSKAVLTPINAPVPTFAEPFAIAGTFTAGADGLALAPDGSNASAIAAFKEQLLNSKPGLTPPTSGISLLADVPIFNLLCVPGECDLAAVSVLQAFCAANRAFYIVDAAQGAILGTGTNGLSATGPADSTGASLINPSASNSAFYFPWVQAPDPMAGFRPAYFPPCGFIAGIYATTDATRGVWKAPAGIDAGLTGALGLQYNLNDLQNGSLNVLGVNCLRQFPNFGEVVWGARTIAGNDAIGSQWKYVPIRRLALFLESSLYQGTQWAVFEPNAEPLWGQVRLSIGAFLQGLFLQGAFAGTAPQQAYFVKCDGDNNPSTSQALGILNISVGFAPLYPAEFVVIQIQQIMSQS
jgi:phage tail sheath protein FI